MRIKFLSVIVSFLLVSFAMSSCLGDDDPVEYSPNSMLMAFELDTVHGVNYKFTIDQLTGKIYNVDSLPVGSDTIIDKIRITKLSVSGFVTIRNHANTGDSVFNMEDSVNLVGTMEILPDGKPGKPFKFKVWTMDMKYSKDYSLYVRVHQQVPDSLQWGKDAMKVDFAPTITGKQKSIIYKEQIFTYAANSPVYSTNLSDGRNWTSGAASGLPSTDLTSIVTFRGLLYATVEGSGKVYSSEDGRTWNEVPSFGEVIRLISPMNKGLSGEILTGIKTFIPENVERFCTTEDGSDWTPGEIAPHSFPRNNISVTTYNNIVGVENVAVVGNVIDPVEKVDTATVVWAYMEGQEWVALNTESKYSCPLLKDPSVMYYGGAFYVFGKDFKTFYKSEAGLVWNEVKSKFMFPVTTPSSENSEATRGFRGKESDYSMVVDKDHFIWIMRSTPNEVWRGRLNRLGFKVQ